MSAGPGAGKTELLAQRADFLFSTQTCRYPRRVLAISFKVDATRNLRERVRERSGEQYAARFDSLTFHAFAKAIVDNYRPVLAGDNALNSDYTIHPKKRILHEQIAFDDLVPLAREILAVNAYARGALRQTYPFVFLDEFQDATEDQFALLVDAFSATDAQLIAVGDVKQRIMVWAGALEGIMDDFAEEFAAVALPLYQNFRSAPRLRRMQNRMIADLDPDAASPAADMVGSDGELESLAFEDAVAEADVIAERIDAWLEGEIPPREIAVLVRQTSRQATEDLCAQLLDRGIPHRIEQDSQDLTAEPAAALILNYLRVLVSPRDPDAYSELIRIATLRSGTEAAGLRFDSQLKTLVREARTTTADPTFERSDAEAYRPMIRSLLNLMTRPVITALSGSYEQGSRLNDIVGETLAAFKNELDQDGDPLQALQRLSEVHSVRILTIHKCKGLEFEKVVVLGVENEFFWGEEADSEFFVACSRAKHELILTHAAYRARPDDVKSWRTSRTARARFLDYADEDAANWAAVTDACGGVAGSHLRAELRTLLEGQPVGGYIPDATIESDIDAAWISTVSDIGPVELVDLTDTDEDKGVYTVVLEAEVTADVSWSSNAPTPFDAETFAGLALDQESEAPILQDVDPSAPLTTQFIAELGPTGAWARIEIDSVALASAEQQNRSQRLTAAELLRLDFDIEDETPI